MVVYMEDNIKIEGDSVVLSINPRLYALETVYSAAYTFLDKAYVLLDGDPEKEILVSLKSKSNEDLDKLGREFFNELVNYADYRERSKQTKEIREMLLQRALITNDPSVLDDNKMDDELLKELEDDYLEDPEEIAIPWEEKYGKDNTGSSGENEDKAK